MSTPFSAGRSCALRPSYRTANAHLKSSYHVVSGTGGETMSELLPLAGIRVLTLEQVHALPWGTAFLAHIGAQVIRIESVEHLQDRKPGPFVNGKAGPEWWNEGANLAYFGTRNK